MSDEDHSGLCLGGPLAGKYAKTRGRFLEAPVLERYPGFPAPCNEPTDVRFATFVYKRYSLAAEDKKAKISALYFWVPVETADELNFVFEELIRSYTEANNERRNRSR